MLLQPGLIAIALASAAFLAALWIAPTLAPGAVTLIKWLLLAPLIEELFFRGVVHSGLRSRADHWGRPGVAIVATAVLFGLAHLVASTALHSAFVVLPALAIGWVYERSRSILLCAVLHSACNAVWFLFWRI